MQQNPGRPTQASHQLCSQGPLPTALVTCNRRYAHLLGAIAILRSSNTGIYLQSNRPLGATTYSVIGHADRQHRQILLAFTIFRLHRVPVACAGHPSRQVVGHCLPNLLP
jgi:hypothetical protein